jgi:hypothetical protein
MVGRVSGYLPYKYICSFYKVLEMSTWEVMSVCPSIFLFTYFISKTTLQILMKFDHGRFTLKDFRIWPMLFMKFKLNENIFLGNVSL